MTFPNTPGPPEKNWQWVPVTPTSRNEVASPSTAPSKRTLRQQTSIPSFHMPAEDNESPTKKRRPRLSNREKFALAFDYITVDVGLLISHFLWELFLYEDEGKAVKRSPSHESAVSIFISGSSKYTLPQVLAQILKFPASTPSRGSVEIQNDMFSLSQTWTSIKRIKPALTTLAISLVTERLVAEITETVKSSSGLYGSVPPSRSGQRKSIGWMDISKDTPTTVQHILQEHSPVTLFILKNLVSPDEVGASVISTRKMRPPDLTSAEILSTIAYCRTPFVRLLPTARAILYFACGAQQTLFQYSSRVGFTPSWNTTVATLKRMAAINAEYVRVLGRDFRRAGVMRTDNIQQWLKRREQRIGKGSRMKIGMSAIVTEAEDLDPCALDLEDKLERIRTSKRAQLTTEQLVGWIDHDHMQLIGTLQWLQVLVNYIPQLATLKPEVSKRFRSKGTSAIMPLPQGRKTHVHPLSTVAKNENITTEFRDALLDFLKQLGQEDDNFIARLLLVSGDGLTYERLLQIKSYMKDQSNSLRRFDIIEPWLETWHTGWTNLSQNFETHWGNLSDHDPSTLGHSATKISQKKPVSLKKVDYYPAAYTAFLVLDVRMLDCWRILFQTDDLFTYFENLERSKKLPSLGELLGHAEILYRRYSTRRAYEIARNGSVPLGVYAIPNGAPWSPPSVHKSSTQNTSDTSASISPNMSKHKKNKGAVTDASSLPIRGDMALARSIMFIHDLMLSREFAQSVADGDPGRMYEAFKHMSVSFAGSSHSKYTHYTLEMICNLELESSPELKQTYLRNILLNPSGELYVEGDLHLEHLNLELENSISHKSGEWDDEHIRSVVAPNIAHFVTLKNTFREGIGLAKCRAKHPAPHSKPEVKILLRTYKDEELHRFRGGRSYGSGFDDVDTFGKGYKELYEGKLSKSIANSTARLASPGNMGHETLEEFVERVMQEDSDDEEEFDGIFSRGGIRVENGELIVDVEANRDEDEEGVQDELEVDDATFDM